MTSGIAISSLRRLLEFYLHVLFTIYKFTCLRARFACLCAREA